MIVGVFSVFLCVIVEEKVKPTCFKTREVLEQVEVLGYIKLKTFYLLKNYIQFFVNFF